MTAKEIGELPWASTNIPKGFDFRNKTPEDLEPLCFGVYVFQGDPTKCKIIYGGLARALLAVAELRLLGIVGTFESPKDSLIDDDGKTIRIRGWFFKVYFTLPA